MKKIVLKLISVLLALATFSAEVSAVELTAEEVSQQKLPAQSARETSQDESTPDISQYVDSLKLAVAETLLSRLYEGDLFAGDTVSRGEFVNVTVRLLKANINSGAESVYKDVTADSTYADGINAARELELISEGDYFRPNDEIQMSEALKIIVSAAGYGEKAEFYGGFSSGYYSEADELEILKGIKNYSGTVKPAQAKIMLYNLLNAEWSDKAYLHTIEGVKFSEASSGKTVLQVFYNILKTEGIINATGYNSMEYDVLPGTKTDYIEIDGNVFTYSEVTYDMLGKYAVAFYDADTEEIIAIDTISKNNIVEYSMDTLELADETTVRYTDANNHIKNLEITGGVVLYNGRAVREIKQEYFDNDGYAIFIDNDDDGKYEVLSLIAYEYMTVGAIDRFNRIINDEKAGETLSFENLSDNMMKLYSDTGEEMNFYGLSRGTVLQILLPQDRSFAEIKVISTQIAGKAESVENDYVIIDGKRYRLSEHFKKYYLNELRIGKTNTYYLGYDNSIISSNESTERFKYGFVIGVSNEVQLRIVNRKKQKS